MLSLDSKALIDFVEEVTLSHASVERANSAPKPLNIRNLTSETFNYFFQLFQTFQTVEMDQSHPSVDSLASMTTNGSYQNLSGLGDLTLSPLTRLPRTFFDAFSAFQTTDTDSIDDSIYAPNEVVPSDDSELYGATKQFLGVRPCVSRDELRLHSTLSYEDMQAAPTY